MLEGKQINLDILPSKGGTYGERDFELYVKPLTAREDMATNLARFGSSMAGYYDNLLDAIEIRGNFNKKNLLYGDIQFIDLIRRLFSYELEEKLYLKGVKCSCGKEQEIGFMFADVHFEDFSEEVFGKEFTFSDGLTVKVHPITVGKFVEVSRKYLSNVSQPKDMGDFVFAYRAASVIGMRDGEAQRVFESNETMQKFAYKYFSELWKNKDLKILEDLDNCISVTVEPIKTQCNECFKELEVFIESSMRFHQE